MDFSKAVESFFSEWSKQYAAFMVAFNDDHERANAEATKIADAALAEFVALATGAILCDVCGKPHFSASSNICYRCKPLVNPSAVLTGRGGHMEFRPAFIQ